MKLMSTLGVCLFMSLFFAVGFGIFGYGLRSWWLSSAAKRWPTAQGTIISCELKENSDSDGATYQAKVKYSYVVDGREYTGDRIAFGYGGSSGRNTHQEIVDRLAAAKTVVVRHDPADPGRAVLSYGINKSTILLLAFGGTWLLFTTGFTALILIFSLGETGMLSTIEIGR